jgi:hypothetical protein
MDKNSANGAKIDFTKADANKEEIKQLDVQSPVEGTTVSVAADSTSSENAEDVNLEFVDVRTVTVVLVKNYSLYRKANDKTLPKRKDFIGSSVYASRILSANKEEVDTYFPNIIGLSPSDPSFVMRVKQYLNNIRIPVDELGRTFDISFHYYKKSDYYRIKAEEDRIERVYQMANRQDIIKLRAALKEKITKINALESTKCKLGYPVNIDDYLMYRHCLLYNDVAKDVAFINSDSNIRFYFKDDHKEAEKLRKFRLEVNKAKANYVACLSDDTLFDAVYTNYCVLNNLPIISSLAEDKLSREIKLDRFSAEEPVKFNKIFNNKDVKLIATIETLIARGELIRSQYNQNITSPDGDFIGANMNEAVAWFKNTENNSVVNALMNKLKNI